MRLVRQRTTAPAIDSTHSTRWPDGGLAVARPIGIQDRADTLYQITPAEGTMRYAAAIVILGAAAASAFAPSEATVQLPSASSKLSADRISKHTASAVLGARGGFTVSLAFWCGAKQQFLWMCAGHSSGPFFHYSMYTSSSTLMNILQYFL